MQRRPRISTRTDTLLPATTRFRSPAAGGDSEVLEADRMLVAFGFAPNVEGYGLDAAGVELTERGAIAVDGRGRTNVENIYAIGDVTAKFIDRKSTRLNSSH